MGDVMLFEDKELRSVYDFDREVPDHKANLYELSKELFKLTHLIANKKQVKFYYPNINNQSIYVDYYHISEDVFSRSQNDIKELLYRNEIAGKDQQQFSLNKNPKQFHIYEPDDLDDYKHYLQLLYFFYILNYFVYPKKNIFKLLSLSHFKNLQSYDERYILIKWIEDNLLSSLPLLIQYNEITTQIYNKLELFSYLTRQLCQYNRHYIKDYFKTLRLNPLLLINYTIYVIIILKAV